jgi:hypothetical protein
MENVPMEVLTVAVNFFATLIVNEGMGTLPFVPVDSLFEVYPQLDPGLALAEGVGVADADAFGFPPLESKSSPVPTPPSATRTPTVAARIR